MSPRLIKKWAIVDEVFNVILDRAEQTGLSGPLRGVEIRIGKAKQFPAVRNFAFCCLISNREAPLIVVAPKFCLQPIERQVALLAHELGHAWYMAQGQDHNERQADAFGELLLGCPIYYDMDLVQNTRKGVRPRPRKLPV